MEKRLTPQEQLSDLMEYDGPGWPQWTYQEAAQALGCSLSTIRNIYFGFTSKASKRLQRSIQKCWDEKGGTLAKNSTR